MRRNLYSLPSLESSARIPLISRSSYGCFKFKILFSKPIALLLFWQFCASLTFNTFTSPLVYIKNSSVGLLVGITLVTGIVFLLSPVIGFIADIKLGQFKVLLYSTYAMLFSALLLALGSGLTFTIRSYNSWYYTVVYGLSLPGELIVCGGYVAFQANILHFSTSQLRDAPTDCSVLYLHASFWSASASSIVALLVNIPGHQFDVYPPDGEVKFDALQSSIAICIFGSSVLGLLVVICILHRKEGWFLTDMIKSNPYRLIFKVLKFAWYHDKPIRRSAFTYWEEEKYTRLDCGKSKYGGPFTTSQVEDVKVMIQILKILLSTGPIFLLQMAVMSSLLTRIHDRNYRGTLEQIKVWIIEYGMLSPFLALLLIPIYLCLLRPFFSRYIPNMFQRIGLAVFLSLVSLILYLLWDIFSYFKNDNPQLPCNKDNSTYLLNHRYFSIPSTYTFVIHHILNVLCELLLYISVWEFICCQTPQDMKGMIFGLLYAIKGFYQFLGAALVLPFFAPWSSQILSCHSAYYLLHLAVGCVSLIGYIRAVKTYKYRKRDEFCDIYQQIWISYSRSIINS